MEKLVRYLAVFWYGIVCVQPASGQYYFYNDDYLDAPLLWELGAGAGGMNCLTDLGGNRIRGGKLWKDINWRNTDVSASLSAGVLFENAIGARIEFAWGRVNASDSILENGSDRVYGRYLRNLSFHSRIRELTFTVELHPLSLPGVFSSGPPGLSPYIFAGVGSFSFEPETMLRGKQVSLHALHTEGQGFAAYPGRKMYRLRQCNIPVGIGLRYEISAVSCFRLEGNYRILSTDYLDDVSTSYIDPAIFYHYLDPATARMASALADRSTKTDPAFSTAPGSIRGNGSARDAYFSFVAKFALVIGRQRR